MSISPLRAFGLPTFSTTTTALPAARAAAAHLRTSSSCICWLLRVHENGMGQRPGTLVSHQHQAVVLDSDTPKSYGILFCHLVNSHWGANGSFNGWSIKTNVQFEGYEVWTTAKFWNVWVGIIVIWDYQNRTVVPLPVADWKADLALNRSAIGTCWTLDVHLCQEHTLWNQLAITWIHPDLIFASPALPGSILEVQTGHWLYHLALVKLNLWE